MCRTSIVQCFPPETMFIGKTYVACVELHVLYRLISYTCRFWVRFHVLTENKWYLVPTSRQNRWSNISINHG